MKKSQLRLRFFLFINSNAPRRMTAATRRGLLSSRAGRADLAGLVDGLRWDEIDVAALLDEAEDIVLLAVEPEDGEGLLLEGGQVHPRRGEVLHLGRGKDDVVLLPFLRCSPRGHRADNRNAETLGELLHVRLVAVHRGADPSDDGERPRPLVLGLLAEEVLGEADDQLPEQLGVPGRGDAELEVRVDDGADCWPVAVDGVHGNFPPCSRAVELTVGSY